ncbi:hypothetical protein EYZ11_009769 [Aspergillus tanneri]|nr:hypothetical protein EYZ11_009769 [Aspergillus tanneri]
MEAMEVAVTIARDGEAIVQVATAFLFPRPHTNDSIEFEDRQEDPVQIHLNSPIDLEQFQGKELVFVLTSHSTFQDKSSNREMRTTGHVYCLSGSEKIRIRSVDFCGQGYSRNPVQDYLRRHGVVGHRAHFFDTPRVLRTDLTGQVSSSSVEYAQA